MRYKIIKNGGYSSGNFNLAGGKISSPLTLFADPIDNLEAATKGYVDNKLLSINASNFKSDILINEVLPGFTGDAFTLPGSTVVTLNNSGVTPGTYTKVKVDSKGRIILGESLSYTDLPDMSWNKIISDKPTTLNGYGITDAISNVGGSLAGMLSCNTIPTNSKHVVTKKYVDDLVQTITNGLKPGDIVSKLSPNTPTGFLRCNGGEVNKLDYPILYSILGDTYAPTRAIGSGRPWEMQYDFNTSTINDITNWTSETNLPIELSSSKVIVTKTKVYLIGGKTVNNAIVSDIYCANITVDSKIVEWKKYSNLPTKFANGVVAVIKNKIYVIGGNNQTSTSDKVYVSTINENDEIGSWTLYGNLPVAMQEMNLVVTSSKIYLLSGITTGNSNILFTYTANINADGSFGDWILENSLSITINNGGKYTSREIIQYKNKVYLIGGYNPATSTSIPVSDIYISTITNGIMSALTKSTISLPVALYGTTSFIYNNSLYVIGGRLTNNFSSNVYKCNINSDGTLSSFTSIGLLKQGLVESQNVLLGNKLYLLGGYYFGRYTANVEINYINSNGLIGDWETETRLVEEVKLPSTVVTKNKVYIIADKIYKANIIDNGKIDKFTLHEDTGILFFNPYVVLTKNRVYFIARNETSDIHTAIIDSDGNLGPITFYSNLPFTLGGSSVVVTRNQIYIIGGKINSNFSASVYSATIESNGLLSSWVKKTDLPVVLLNHSAVVVKDYIYLLGGSYKEKTDPGTAVSANYNIYRSFINLDGSLSSWTKASSVPYSLFNFQVAVTNSKLFIFNANNTNAVYSANIATNGILSAFSSISSLISPSKKASLFTTSSRIYLIGGMDDSASNFKRATIFSAPFEGGKNEYMSLVDILPIADGMFRLPDLSNTELDGLYNYIKY